MRRTSPRMRVGIALGSNLGDRLRWLREAADRLKALHEGADAEFLCSGIYETLPVDCPGDSPAFLNAAVECTSSLLPTDILSRLQSIERDFGRPETRTFHAPRTLDLDLLYCGDLRISLPTLELPHPRIAERFFVLRPLRDICADLVLPGQTQSIRELLDALPDAPPGKSAPLFHFQHPTPIPA